MTGGIGPKINGLTRLRNYFLTGLIVVAPLAITVYLIWTFVQWVDSWIIPYIPDIYNPETYLPFDMPGVGLVMALFIITMIGFLTANIVGRTLIGYGEKLLGRMPIVRSIYNGLKQVFETVLSESSTSFTSTAMVEYPRRNIWAIVFISGDTRGEVRDKLHGREGDTVSVFMPSTPNPTTGFLMFVPKSDVIPLEMSLEDAAKLVISAGLIAPNDYQQKLATLVSEVAPGKKPTRRPRKAKQPV